MDEIIIRPGSKELPEVQRLYEEAFPEDEQIPFERLINDRKACILRAYYQDAQLCALSYVFECQLPPLRTRGLLKWGLGRKVFQALLISLSDAGTSAELRYP